MGSERDTTALAVLEQEGIVSAAEVERAKTHGRTAMEPAVCWLLTQKKVSEEDLYFLLTRQQVAPIVPDERLLNLSLSPVLRRRCPKWLALRFLFVPLDFSANGTLSVAAFDPTDLFSMDRLAAHLGAVEMRKYLGRRSSIVAAIDQCYGDRPVDVDEAVLDQMRARRGASLEASETQVELIPGKVSLDPGLFREMAEADPSMAQESLKSRAPRGREAPTAKMPQQQVSRPQPARVSQASRSHAAPRSSGASRSAQASGSRSPAGQSHGGGGSQGQAPRRGAVLVDSRLRRAASGEVSEEHKPEGARQVRGRSLLKAQDEDLTQVALRLRAADAPTDAQRTADGVGDAQRTVEIATKQSADPERGRVLEGHSHRVHSPDDDPDEVTPPFEKIPSRELNRSLRQQPGVGGAKAVNLAESSALVTSASELDDLVIRRDAAKKPRREDTVRTEHPAALDVTQKESLTLALHVALGQLLSEVTDDGSAQRHRGLALDVGRELEFPRATAEAIATAAALCARHQQLRRAAQETVERDLVHIFTADDSTLESAGLSRDLRALGAACLGLPSLSQDKRTVAAEVAQLVVDYASLGRSDSAEDLETVAQLLRAGGVDSLLLEALMRVIRRRSESAQEHSAPGAGGPN